MATYGMHLRTVGAGHIPAPGEEEDWALLIDILVGYGVTPEDVKALVAERIDTKGHFHLRSAHESEGARETVADLKKRIQELESRLEDIRYTAGG